MKWIPPSFLFTGSQNDGGHPKEKMNSILVDCGATLQVIDDKNFVNIVDKFKREEHFIEVADGKHENNIAWKRYC